MSTQLMTIYLGAGGLNTLWSNLLDNWIGPLFLAAVAVFALVFIKDRAWMKLISFVGIAAVVGVLVFAGKEIFGKQGKLKKTAENLANQVEVVQAPTHGADLDAGFLKL